jgi:excisionase family DNA binding protein
MDARWMTVAEGAAYARISRSGLYKFIAAGRLPIRKLGARSLIDREDIDRLIEGTAAPTAKVPTP